MRKREYRDYVNDILNSIIEIESFIKNISHKEFLQDRKTQNAVIRSIEVMGEAAKHLPKSLRDKDPSIPWKKIAGMRDKLIHEYFGTDYETVWKTAKHIIPKLKNKIKKFADQISEV